MELGVDIRYIFEKFYFNLENDLQINGTFYFLLPLSWYYFGYICCSSTLENSYFQSEHIMTDHTTIEMKSTAFTKLFFLYYKYFIPFQQRKYNFNILPTRYECDIRYKENMNKSLSINIKRFDKSYTKRRSTITKGYKKLISNELHIKIF